METVSWETHNLGMIMSMKTVVETYTFIIDVGNQPSLPILRPCML